MKKVFWVTILMALALVFPVSTMARVDVGISISLPPLIVFAAPPEVVVLPETNVYAVPDLDVDIFFYGGWWWRPWEGRWYRSRNYNSGWGYYRNVPSFYRGIPAGWRNDYREGRWKGHQWDHERIPHEQVQKNWRNWEKNRHWEKQNSWGVKGLKPRQNSRQQKSEVRQQQPRVQPQPRKAEPQHREVQPQSRPQTREAVKRQQSQPRNEKPEKARKDKRD
ncbi:MAG: hypothetical protein ACYDH8_08050 [Syntrophales bacterium]